MTMEMWHHLEAEWEDCPHVDDMAAHYFGWHRAQLTKEIPMSAKEYFAKFHKAPGGKRDGI